MSEQHRDVEVGRSIDESTPRRASFHRDPIQGRGYLRTLSVSPIRSVLGAIGAIFGSGNDVISLASGQGTQEYKTYLCTDSGNAELFAKIHGENVRFDHRQQRWLLWDDKGGRWVEDKQGCVRGLMKTTARERLRTAVERPESDGRRKREIKWALDSENRYGIEAALELAKSESPVRDSGDRWDANPLLFGVANGVVDLQTGTLRKGRRTDLITKSSPVTFNSDARCARFEQFISEIFGNDKELTGFVQKAVGYSLTGSVQEQCLFACYGEGRNGKSTLLEVVLYILGDYGVDLPCGALEVKRGSPGEGVNLPGSRFAKSVEIREGRKLDEARVKSWTGGDTISVRPLYRNAFSFQPTHKIWLAFNHKPVITDDSPGMWRRIRLIPFQCKFAGPQADHSLLAKLKAEASGVLNWAIQGSLAWQKEGLGVPRVVEQATKEYQDESDVVVPFLEDCFELDSSASVESAQLWSMYQLWTSRNGEPRLARNLLAAHLKRRGFTTGESGHDKRRIWRGLRLRRVEAGVRVYEDQISNTLSIDSSHAKFSVSGYPQTPAGEADAENKELGEISAGAQMTGEKTKC